MSARFHPYLCGRNAAEWLIDMMDFETTLSNAADTKADTPVVQEQDGKTVVVIQQAPAAEPEETTDSDSLLSSALDSQPVDESGLPAVVKSVFGEYHPRTQTVTETRTDGTVLTSVECVPGLAGLDWYWLSGVFMFALVLWSFFRFIGVVFKR